MFLKDLLAKLKNEIEKKSDDNVQVKNYEVEWSSHQGC